MLELRQIMRAEPNNKVESRSSEEESGALGQHRAAADLLRAARSTYNPARIALESRAPAS